MSDFLIILWPSQNMRTLVCIRYLAFASGYDNKNHNNIEVNNTGISANEKNIVSTDYTAIVSISVLLHLAKSLTSCGPGGIMLLL